MPARCAYVRRDDNAVYFLSDVSRHKDDEIRQYRKVCLAFVDTSGQKYVSLAGHAEVSTDRGKIRELWGTPAKAWWDSPDDPNIRVLKVTPQEAEFWEGSGTMMSTIKMAAAAMTGNRADMGETARSACDEQAASCAQRADRPAEVGSQGVAHAVSHR
jgi:general stress protein 26